MSRTDRKQQILEDTEDRAEARRTVEENGAKNRKHHWLTADKIVPTHMEWLYTGYIPAGYVGLLAGREGLGKSLITDWIAARLSRGDLPGKYFGTPTIVIIAATEDNWSGAIVPRLMAADADLTKIVHVLVTVNEDEEDLSMPADLPQLKADIQKSQAAGEIVSALMIDPLLGQISGKLDTHKDAEVRKALRPLGKLAETTSISVICIIHVNKSGSVDPLDSVMGSRAFTAYARFVLFAMQDPNDESIRFFGLPKINYGAASRESKTYQVITAKPQAATGDIFETGLVDWTGTIPKSIYEILQDAKEQQQAATKQKTGQDLASKWLKNYLNTNGPTDSKQVKTDSEAAGFGSKMIGRAADDLLVTRRAPQNDPKARIWALPVNPFVASLSTP